MSAPPRVAFFSDSFHEVNGVAHTCRKLFEFARSRDLPFLSIRGGARTMLETAGNVTVLELHRGPVGFRLEADFPIDVLLWRHRRRIRDALAAFRPDVIHVTGPADIGLMGLLYSTRLRLPLVASWHTNVHEYAGRRLSRLLSFLPQGGRDFMARMAEDVTWHWLLWFYRHARELLAPNEELASMLRHHTGRPCSIMERGIDTDQFSPARRDRRDDDFVIGYVGRLSTEKNVRLLADVDRLLSGHRFLIVGDGSERAWLEQHLWRAEFTGVLRGEALGRAYANMDVFAFPSETDTFGNVVLESLASGVPAVVTSKGGPKYIIRDGETGFVADGAQAFADAIGLLIRDRQRQRQMSAAARAQACRASWTAIFEGVYEVYQRACHAAHSKARAG